MNFKIKTLVIAMIITGIGINAASAQNSKHAKAADYSIADIAVNAFSGSTNELSEVFPANGTPLSFFNDLDTSLFTWVLIQGEPGTFEAGRMASIVVKEGKKIILTRTQQIGIPNEKGFYTVPVYVYGPLCSEVTISARIVGQKTASRKTVKVPFNCGE